MCSHVLRNILSAIAFWPQETTEKRERLGPTGGSNNLKDSGLCRWCPTEVAADLILHFSAKPLLPFPQITDTAKHKHTQFHSASFDYSSVS